jgi:putative ABC transport system ATP-binding protein
MGNAEFQIELRQLSKIYGRHDAAVTALRSISIAVQRGTFAMLTGPSGSGKSTCLSIIGGLERPSTGEYLFDGVSMTALGASDRAVFRRRIGFVFQSFHLLPAMTAIENVELPLVYRSVPRAERKRLAAAALEELGIADRATHLPSQLSGGQQQRVAIARAIVASPALMIADEPTGNLDSQLAAETLLTLRRLNRELGMTVVMTTHDSALIRPTDQRIELHDGVVLAPAISGL